MHSGPWGNKNAFKHGLYTAEAMAQRRKTSGLMRAARALMHGGPSPGAPKGNKNAFKHGLYTAEAIAGRRKISGLMREARALARNR